MGWRDLFKIYWFAGLATLTIWVLVGWKMGLAALLTTVTLTLLETTFSADNAVINSKVLVTMSAFWQRLFMTVGIFIAVFVVRFYLPILIVMITASLGFSEVLDLALHHPEQYEEEVLKAEPVISAFGGTFLLMIALSYFIDYNKENHWIGFLERKLGKWGRFDNATTFITLILSLVLYLSVEPEHQTAVLLASIVAMTLHLGLELLGSIMGSPEQYARKSMKKKVGWAAFAAFMYLEVLDASFSLDGVIGAFALTNNIILIMAGLGAGAVWVRAMTIHLIRADALKKYIFLEPGAHWAIAFLGAVMLLKLFHIALPEWFVGSLGLGFIGVSIWWSVRHTKKVRAPSPGL